MFLLSYRLKIRQQKMVLVKGDLIYAKDIAIPDRLVPKLDP